MIKILALASLFTAVSIFGSCEPKTPPDCGAGSSSSASSSTGPDCAGTAKAGAPCVTDCDCCGHACASLTAADGTVSHVCSAPCVVTP